MAGSETGEIIELPVPERGEETGLAAQVTGAFEAASAGEDLGAHLKDVSDDLGGSWMVEVDGLGEGLPAIQEQISGVLETIADVAKELSAELSEVVEDLRKAIGEALEVFAEGVQWLREHPEVVRAAAQILVIGVACAENPELMAKYLMKHPELIEKPMATIHAAL